LEKRCEQRRSRAVLGPRVSDDPMALLRTYRQTGDPVARERLVGLYLPLVRALARRYANCGERFEDLVQVASIGLIEAIERFDPERGSSLSGFAVPTITGAIKNHLRDRASTVRVPRRQAEVARGLRAPRSRLAARLGRLPSVAELAREAGIAEGDVAQAIETEQYGLVVSLSDADDVADTVRSTALDDAFAASDNRLLVAAGFRTLSERERRILHLRYFAGLSQMEIADEIGLSQVQVSRLLRASLERMRSALVDRDRAIRARERPVVGA
jgi:RNA polymerase sigma-B factor